LTVASEITLKAFRYDPEEGEDSRRYDVYRVPFKRGMTVLEALFWVLENADGSLAFRYSCRGAVCGNCAMFINGSFRLACKTQVASLGTDVTVDPLPYMKPIKDLVVDMGPFFEKYERIKPYLITLSEPPEGERLQSQRERARIDEVVNCILCGGCYASCPATWSDPEYLGPAALTKAYRFLADSRDEDPGERLDVVAGEDGLWRCHTIFNCVEACPKNINGTEAIQALKRMATRRALFGGGR